MEIKKIYEEQPLDKEISVKGWIRKHRKQKEIGFIELSDGTCFKKQNYHASKHALVEAFFDFIYQIAGLI